MLRTFQSGWRLRWIISLAVMGMTLILSAVLIGTAYLGQRALLVEASGQMAHQMAISLNTASSRLLRPLKSGLRLLTHDPLMQAETLQQRQQRLPLLLENLHANPMLDAVYVAYADHDFLLLRRLKSDRLRQSVSAPPQAAWLLQSIDDEQRLWRFYDVDTRLIEEREVPEYRFDPHRRDWYQAARRNPETALTPPYPFYTTGVTGVTLSLAGPAGTVVAFDASVADISAELEHLKPAPGYRMAVVAGAGQVVAWPDVAQMLRSEEGKVRLVTLDELGAPELTVLQQRATAPGRMLDYTLDGESWYGTRVPLVALGGEPLDLLVTVPARELLADAHRQSIGMLAGSVLVALLMLVAGWYGTARVTRPLDRLTEQVRALARFDFSRQPARASAVREVQVLGRVLEHLTNTIRHFQAISLTLARERDLTRMLPTVAEHLKACVGARACHIYVHDPQHDRLLLNTGEDVPADVAVLDAVGADADSQCQAVRARLGDDAGACLMIPLQGREAGAAGVMVLQLAPDHSPEAPLADFIGRLSGAAAVAIETRQLIESQQQLMDAIIRLLADSIDAKSPHTNRHCERVPELAGRLMEAARHSRQPPFADFDMSRAERDEFQMAAWLHDCGKITTPEHILDKATRLDALYNRIHEIRTRFEVLWRDARIQYLEAVLAGESEPEQRRQRERREAQLQADFARVARINQGGETLSDDDRAALQRIGAQTWWRHFDNRLGLSACELARMPSGEVALPVMETLLADRPEHVVNWGERRPPVAADDPDNIWGFDMALPDAELNLGECYNLSQPYGTLTPEERFSINNHIVQTIRMLEQLPWPAHLKRVPQIAGNHHERMDGNGYPRRLQGAELSIPERIMAVADVFEALTAADRPYKKAKPLSEALRIMARMARDGHLDPALYRLFLDQALYEEYARRYLKPEQIDAVDVEALHAVLKSGYNGKG